jgi:hypothetical protein
MIDLYYNDYDIHCLQLPSPPDIFFDGDVNKFSELSINNGSYHSISSNCKISIQTPADP